MPRLAIDFAQFWPHYPRKMKTIRPIFFLPIAALLLGFGVHGQTPTGALDGTYNIGASTSYSPAYNGRFAKLSDAIQHLNNFGIAGPVTLVLRDETYSEFPLTLTRSGTAANPIVLKPHTGVTPEVNFNITTLGASGLRLLGVSHFSIEGSAAGTGTNDITFRNSGGVPAKVLELSGVCTNVSIRDCRLVPRDGNNANFGIYAQGSGQDFLTFEGNRVDAAFQGIVLEGLAFDLGQGNRVVGNEIGGTSQNLSRSGILARFQENAVISGNKVSGLRAAAEGAGLELVDLRSSVVEGNLLWDLRALAADVRVAGIAFTASAADPGGSIQNNMIWQLSGPGGSLPSQTLSGILVAGGFSGQAPGIWHNTVWLGPAGSNGLDNPSAGTFAACLTLDNATGSFDVRNNIFQNALGKKTASANPAQGHGIHDASGALPFSALDYNLYHLDGDFDQLALGFSGSARTSLADWRAATGREANSDSVRVPFRQGADLRLGNSCFTGNGITLPGVTTDFEGQARANPPTIGADEVAIVPLSGTYVVGLSSGDFGSMGEAFAELGCAGVGGPVVFQVQMDTYPEQLSLGTIPGASATRPVTFRSLTGNASDVVVESSPQGGNWVLRLSGSAYVRFQNLTFRNLGATPGMGRVVVFDQGANQIELTGCVLQGAALTTDKASACVALDPVSAGDVCRDLLVSNNQVSGGHFGFYVSGFGAAHPATGIALRQNQVRDCRAAGIWAERLADSPIEANDIRSPGTPSADFAGIVAKSCLGGTQIIRNQLVLSGITGTAAGLRATSNLVALADPVVVANNFVSEISSPGLANGIEADSNQGLVVGHNTVSLSSGAPESHAAVLLLNSQSVVSHNIFDNRGNGRCVLLDAAGPSLSLDHNAYFYKSGMATYNNLPKATLSDWQSATGYDIDAVFYPPIFVSNTNLRLVTCQGSLRMDTNLPAAGADIDGQARGASPLAGADEVAGGPSLSGNYTINPALPEGGTNFQSFDAALDRVMCGGITGPVVFTVSPGIYQEQLLLSFVNGSSATNTIRFVSQGNDPGAVAVRHETTSQNWVLKCSFARHTTFQGIGFFNVMTANDLGRVLVVSDGSSQLTFDNCAFYGRIVNSGLADLATATLDAQSGLGLDMGDLRFNNCQFVGGSQGLVAKGHSPYAGLARLTVSNCRMEGYFDKGLAVENLREGIFQGNFADASGAAGQQWAASFTRCAGLDVKANELKASGSLANHVLLFERCLPLAPGGTWDCFNNKLYQNAGTAASEALSVVESDGLRFFHNTIKVEGAVPEHCALRLLPALGDRAWLENNIFWAPTVYGLDDPSSLGAASVLDYNLVYSPLARIAQSSALAFASLADWQAASGLSANDWAVRPLFVSATDLDIRFGNNRGRPMPEVATDFDGLPRDASAPDVGAHESSLGLGGTYNIGASSSYSPAYDGKLPDLEQAIDALNYAQRLGAVRFVFRDEAYAEPALVLRSGGTAAWPVRFSVYPGRTPDISFQLASTDQAAWTFEDVDHFTLDGSDASGNAALTLKLAAGSSAGMLRFRGGCATDSVRACALQAASLAAGSFGVELLGPAQDFKLLGNRVSNALHGFVLRGQAGMAIENLVAWDNELTNLGGTGIWLEQVLGAELRRNRVEGISSNNLPAIGLLARNSQDILLASNDFAVLQSAVAGQPAVGIWLDLDVADPQVWAYNNRVWLVQSPGSADPLLSDAALRLDGTASQGIALHHNSCFQQITALTGQFAGLLVNGPSGIDLRNNIFHLSQPEAISATTATGYALRSLSAGNPFAAIDHNIYYVDGFGQNRLARADATELAELDSWRGFTLSDANSIWADPRFQGPADLRPRLDFPTPAEGAAMPIAAIADDRLGVVRQGQVGYAGTGTAPDIGAHEGEFLPVPDYCAGIEADTEWCGPMDIYCDIRVAEGASLTLCPGTVLTFRGYFGLEVQGNLQALGTEAQPIVFTVADTAGLSNTATRRGAWAGIRFDQTPAGADSSRLVHCQIQYAKATDARAANTDSDNGGALWLRSFARLRVDHCQLRHNHAAARGGAFWAENAGFRLISSRLTQNRAPMGGAGYASGGGLFIANSLFWRNQAPQGGALALAAGQDSLFNLSFSANSATQGGALHLLAGAATRLTNCLLWDDVASSGAEVFLAAADASPVFSHCDLEGLAAGFGLAGGVPTPGALDPTNFSADPLFLGAAAGDFRLSAGTPCQEAGLAGTLLDAYPLDLAGQRRRQECRVDVGAYEAAPRVWTGYDLVWLGCDSPDWHDAENWNLKRLPGPDDKLYLPGLGVAPTQPLLSAPATCWSLDVQADQGASLSVGAGAELELRQP